MARDSLICLIICQCSASSYVLTDIFFSIFKFNRHNYSSKNISKKNSSFSGKNISSTTASDKVDRTISWSYQTLLNNRNITELELYLESNDSEPCDLNYPNLKKIQLNSKTWQLFCQLMRRLSFAY